MGRWAHGALRNTRSVTGLPSPGLPKGKLLPGGVTGQEFVHTLGEIRSKTNRRLDLRGRRGLGRPGSLARSTPGQGALGATRDAVDSGGKVRTVYRLVFEHLVEGSGEATKAKRYSFQRLTKSRWGGGWIFN